jgi:hypothetical protein
MRIAKLKENEKDLRDILKDPQLYLRFYKTLSPDSSNSIVEEIAKVKVDTDLLTTMNLRRTRNKNRKAYNTLSQVTAPTLYFNTTR